MTADLAGVAQTLRVDAMTEDVLTAFAAASVPALLLKGPVLADWLYAPGERAYGDCDLLVEPASWARAEAALAGMGFSRVARDWESAGRREHDAPWHHPATGTVDLHRLLPGVHGLSPEQLWHRLRGHRRPFPALRHAQTLDEPGLALLVALHVAHHRELPALREKPIEDLERALRLAPPDTWRAAAALARRLRCAGQMSRGLHACPGGARLAAGLRLPPPAREERSWDPAPLRALTPAPSWLRWTHPGQTPARAYVTRLRTLARR